MWEPEAKQTHISPHCREGFLFLFPEISQEYYLGFGCVKNSPFKAFKELVVGILSKGDYFDVICPECAIQAKDLPCRQNLWRPSEDAPPAFPVHLLPLKQAYGPEETLPSNGGTISIFHHIKDLTWFLPPPALPSASIPLLLQCWHMGLAWGVTLMKCQESRFPLSECH